MKEEIEVLKEIEKLKNAPQYVDLFCKMIKQKLGDNPTVFRQCLDQVIMAYKKEENLKVYSKLISLQLEQDLAYGDLNHAIKMGETAICFFEEQAFKEGNIIVSERLMLVYMNKGLFKKANEYRVKALSILHTLQEDEEAVHLKEVVDIEEAENESQEEHTQDATQVEDNRLFKDTDNIANRKLHIQLIISTIQLYIMIKEYKEARVLLEHMKEINNCLTPKEIQEIQTLWLELELVEGNIEQAITHAQEAYSLLDDEDSSTQYALVKTLTLRGILNGKRDLHMQAEKDFKLAEVLGENYQVAKVRNLMNWVDYLIIQEQVDEAYKKIMVAIKIAEQIDSPYFLAEIYERVCQIHEQRKEWELAYKMLSRLNMYRTQVEQVQIEEVDQSESILDQMKAYKQSYKHFDQIARLGKVFTTQMIMEALPIVIEQEIISLIDMDVLGMAMMGQNKLEYKVYERSGKWLSSENELMKYTERVADYCTQFQADIIVNDGNFEEYTIKNIINSETDMKLQSMLMFVLKVENQVLGAMMLGSYKGQAYSKKDIAMARILASYFALMLKNTYLYEKNQYLLEHDALTGVLSRSVVLSKGEQLFKENHKKHQSTAIIMLDTDLLKHINTKYGYELGDEVLSKIGKNINEIVPEGNYVGRYDGEEFMIVLNHLSYKEVIKIADRIQKSIEQMTFETKKDHQIKVTLSGGIYICNEYTLNFDDAIRFASHALYRAKLLGRNRIMSYSLNNVK